MLDTGKYLSAILKENKELEGGLFAEISLRYCGRDYVARRDLYTVKSGIVYNINEDGSLYATGDNLYSLKRDCHRIGKYNPNKKYKFNTWTFSYAEIKKSLKI